MFIMQIAVIGLGYVGCVAAAKLAVSGHKVVGVDISVSKVRSVNQGRPTVVEPGLESLCNMASTSGNLQATTDIKSIIDETEVFYICVGTPLGADGDLDMRSIFRVVEEIAGSLKVGLGRKTLITRSTVKPGTNTKIKKMLEGKNISVVMNPEFLREGKALDDWDHPGLVVIGAFDDYGKEVVEQLHSNVSAPVHLVQPQVAEIIKYINNSWHALKVVFGNEIGRLCRGLEIDSEQLMDLFLADKKLNLSSSYLRPGMPYGGSCLSKDLSALIVLARKGETSLPVLESVGQSNWQHARHIADVICSTGKKRVGIVGLAFKKETDDLRNSPSITIVDDLKKRGLEVHTYDSNVHLDSLFGQNKAQVKGILPILQKSLVPDLEDMVQKVDVVAVMHDISIEMESLKKKFPEKLYLDIANYKV
jgi:GDP-mannose 6-dehydrogenase